MRSSPTRTFSPSDLCLEAGCVVHQQASPVGGGGVRAAQNALPQSIPSHGASQALRPKLSSYCPQLSASQSPVPVLRLSACLPESLCPECVHPHPQTLSPKAPHL